MNKNLFLAKNHGNLGQFLTKNEAGAIFRAIISIIKGIYNIFNTTIAPKV